jgi:hypothetical protein
MNQHLQSIIAALGAAALMYGGVAQPATQERDESTLTAQAVIKELHLCQAALRECWKECR